MSHIPTFDVSCLSGSLIDDRAEVAVGDNFDDGMSITFKCGEADICAVAMTHAQWWALIDAMKDWLQETPQPLEGV